MPATSQTLQAAVSTSRMLLRCTHTYRVALAIASQIGTCTAGTTGSHIFTAMVSASGWSNANVSGGLANLTSASFCVAQWTETAMDVGMIMWRRGTRENRVMRGDKSVEGPYWRSLLAVPTRAPYPRRSAHRMSIVEATWEGRRGSGGFEGFEGSTQGTGVVLNAQRRLLCRAFLRDGRGRHPCPRRSWQAFPWWPPSQPPQPCVRLRGGWPS